MKAKKVRLKCQVRGCRNTQEVYSVSKSSEAGRSVILCAACAKEACKAIEEAAAGMPERKITAGAPPLFFSGGQDEQSIAAVPGDIVPEEQEEPEETGEQGQVEKHLCQYCGKECSDKRGLSSHERACKKKQDLKSGEADE